MECEAKDPARYLSILCLSVFYLGGFDHVPCECNVFLTAWSVVVPLDVSMVLGFLRQGVDLGHYVIKGKTCEIKVEGEKTAVTLANVFKGT